MEEARAEEEEGTLMGKLSAAARRALPASTFAGPGRSFPIPDAGHAKAALGRINNAPPSARPKIRAKAEAMIAKKGT